MKSIWPWKVFNLENSLPWKSSTVKKILPWKLLNRENFFTMEIWNRANQSLSILKIEYRENISTDNREKFFTVTINPYLYRYWKLSTEKKIYRERCSTVKIYLTFWAVKINPWKYSDREKYKPWKVHDHEKCSAVKNSLPWKNSILKKVLPWKIFDRENQSLIMVHIRDFEPWKIHDRENDQK